MSIINHLEIWREETCPHCHKKYRCIYTEQIPGFRDTEEKICPYCGEVIEKSMEYEFNTERIP